MSANQEVGQYPRPLASLLAVRAPHVARQEMGLTAQRLHTDLIPMQKTVTFTLGVEMDAELGVNQIANDERSIGRCIFQRQNRRVTKLHVPHQNVEQDIRVDGSDHSMRSAAAHIIHETVDGRIAEFFQTVLTAPFPFSKIEFPGSLLQPDGAADNLEF